MAERITNMIQDIDHLTRLSSTSGLEGQAAAYVFRNLREMGHKGARIFGRETMVRTLDDFDQARSVGILIPGKNPNVLFVANGHLDTVTSDATVRGNMQRREDTLYGRGVGDMNAGLAVMLDLAREYPDGEAPCDIFLSFVDQEETTSQGSLVQARWIHDNIMKNYPGGVGGIILEPTYRERDGTVKGFVGFGHRGGSFFTVNAYGEGGHGGHDFSSKTTAFTTLNTFIQALPGIQKSWSEPYSDEYGVPTINATVVRAGEVDNIVPDSASARIDLRTTKRFVPAWPQIHAGLEQRYSVDIIQPADLDLSVSHCDPASRIYRATVQVWPREFEVFPYGSDQPAFAKYEIPMLLYGPGNVEKLHGPEDNVHIGALEECRDKTGKFITVFASNI